MRRILSQPIETAGVGTRRCRTRLTPEADDER
jgi:hypothetical protein